MRTALISAVKRSVDGGLRADLTMAGRSVLSWQTELARDLKCERIVCLCDAPTDTTLSLQKEVEGAGGEFHAIRTNLQLVSLIRADDELVMVGDGVLPDRALVLQFAGSGGPETRLKKGIATLSAAHTLSETHPDDFERIDRDRHWAGVAIMRAGQVQQLADLPPDGDAMSLLLRLALQAKVECRPLTSNELDTGRWMVAGSEAALAETERSLLKSSASQPPWTGPSASIAALITRAIAPRWLDKGAETSGLAAGALMIAGLGLTGAGYGAAGLSVAAVGAFGGAISEAWSHLRSSLWSRKADPRRTRRLHAGIDVITAAALVLALLFGAPFAVSPIVQISLPVMAIGLSNLAAGAFWRDRTLHLIGFAAAAGFGYLGEALAVFGVAALLQLLIRRELGPTNAN